MRVLRFFIWLIIPATLYLGYLMWGLPHLNWVYSWRDDGQGYDPFAERHFLVCTYWGPFGAHTIYPLDGHCPRIKFIKANGGAN